MSFFSINVFLILDLVNKMSMKVWFIKEVHNKIQIEKNIERVQNKQQKMILKWNLIYDKL
jgi:hypothetical protein